MAVYNSNVSISGNLAAAGSLPTITVATGTGTSYVSGTASWTNNTNTKMTAQGELHIVGDNADIVVNGVRLSETLKAINERLSIIQVNPELHSKYDNLRQAYEHYKTLEALLYEQEKAEK